MMKDIRSESYHAVGGNFADDFSQAVASHPRHHPWMTPRKYENNKTRQIEK